MAASFAVKFAVVGGCVGAAAQERPAAAILCGGDEVARGAVSHILDGRTFELGDGSDVRLAAIEVPQSQPRESGAATKAALAAIAAGSQVVLRRAEFNSDRYGRIVAYGYALRDGSERFIQAELISAGLALVGDRVGARNCAAELLRREAAARAAKLGLWASSYYDLLHADNPADVLAQRGRFALVEGKVVSVRESGATIYVNFGRHWSEDFAVTILKRNERSFTAAGLDLKTLAGRRVRVRGWIEARNGGGSPWIEAARPEQIEPVDQK